MRISDWSSDVCSSDLVSRATVSSTVRIRVADLGSSTAGTKSGVQPWILCGDQSLPASSEATAGSAAVTCTSGRATRSTSATPRSEEHTSELQSLMRISYAVFCLKKKKTYLIN